MNNTRRSPRMNPSDRLVALVVLILAFSCYGCEGRGVCRANADSNGQSARVRLGLKLSALRESDQGDLCATMQLVNESTFPVLLRIPVLGVKYEARLHVEHRDTVGMDLWLKVFEQGRRRGSTFPANRYVLLYARLKPGFYNHMMSYRQSVILVGKKEYARLKQVVGREREPMRLVVSVHAWYLDSCPGVREADARPIRHGAYNCLTLTQTVKLVVPKRPAPSEE